MAEKSFFNSILS